MVFLWIFDTKKQMKDISIGSDHAGFEAKELVKDFLKTEGFRVKDFGTFSEESVDYPEFAVKVAHSINIGEFERGILICGSGQGVCMTANKFPKVRAALVYNAESARLTRQHNNANILCLPGRSLNHDQLKQLTKIWLETDFEGGRHQRRVDKIESLTSTHPR